MSAGKPKAPVIVIKKKGGHGGHHGGAWKVAYADFVTAMMALFIVLWLLNKGENEDNIPKVFESAGGFAPTIGIIGAVLGLIQVMQHLDNIEEVGRGIAVAFVATIYGVGMANLVLLPSAGKLRIRIREEQILHEMMLEGVVSILEGMNPRMIETKLISFLAEAPSAPLLREPVA